jgi:AcrR family transcriptional regulator
MASELQKNAEKLRKAMMLRPGLTIREMMVEEVSLRGIGRRRAADVAVEGSASLALVWLERLLRMLLRLMARLAEDGSSKLSDCVARAYDETLRPHHALWTQRVVLAAAWTAPSRADFFTRLGSDRATIEKSIGELVVYLEPALTCVQGDVLETLGEVD